MTLIHPSPTTLATHYTHTHTHTHTHTLKEAYDPDKAAYVAVVYEYFSLMDTDDSGIISLDAAAAAGSKLSLSDDMKDMDPDGNGTVSKADLLSVLMSKLASPDDYAEEAAGLAGYIAELKEKAEAKADDGGKKSQGRERGGVRSGCKEGGSE